MESLRLRLYEWSLHWDCPYTRICTAVIQNKKKPSPSPHFKIIRTICFLSHPLRLNPRSVLPRPASDTGGGAPRSGDGVSRSGVGGLRSGGAACGGGRYRGQRCCRSADRPPPPHAAVPPAAAAHVHRLPRALQHGAGNPPPVSRRPRAPALCRAPGSKPTKKKIPRGHRRVIRRDGLRLRLRATASDAASGSGSRLRLQPPGPAAASPRRRSRAGLGSGRPSPRPCEPGHRSPRSGAPPFRQLATTSGGAWAGGGPARSAPSLADPPRRTRSPPPPPARRRARPPSPPVRARRPPPPGRRRTRRSR